MARQHTPGPWRAHLEQATVAGHDCTFTTAEIYPTTGRYRGDITRLQSCEHIGGIAGDELTADAHLIAAAPDLLRLVDLVHGSFRGGLVVTFSEADVAEFAAAIAKARGQS